MKTFLNIYIYIYVYIYIYIYRYVCAKAHLLGLLVYLVCSQPVVAGKLKIILQIRRVFVYSLLLARCKYAHCKCFTTKITPSSKLSIQVSYLATTAISHSRCLFYNCNDKLPQYPLFMLITYLFAYAQFLQSLVAVINRSGIRST